MAHGEHSTDICWIHACMRHRRASYLLKFKQQDFNLFRHGTRISWCQPAHPDSLCVHEKWSSKMCKHFSVSLAHSRLILPLFIGPSPISNRYTSVSHCCTFPGYNVINDNSKKRKSHRTLIFPDSLLLLLFQSRNCWGLKRNTREKLSGMRDILWRKW